MRVAWVTREASFLGGAERYIAGTARRLAGRDVHSTLLYDPTRPFDTDFAAPFAGAFPLVDIRAQVTDLKPDVFFLHQWPGAEVPEALADTGVPVARFLHDHRLFCLREHKVTALGGRPCTRVAGLKCYACPGFIQRSPRWPGLRVVGLASLRREQAANRRLDALVVPSSYLRDHAIAHGFPADRLHVFPLFVDLPPDPAPVTPRDPDRLLFVGALTRGKGLDILLDAMERLHWTVRLTVVGSGPQAAWFRRLTARRGLDRRVAFLGTLDAASLAAQYRTAACLVLPNRQPETFGLVGPEALGHATPVVASRIGGVGEWLQDGVTGLAVPPCDPAALATAIRTLLDDPARAAALGEAGRAFVAERLRPEAHLDALMGLLESLADRRAGEAR